MDNSYGCDQLLSLLLFGAVWIFVLHMVIIILAKNSIELEEIKSIIFSEISFTDYLNKFSEKDIQCIEELYEDLDKE